MPVAGNWMLLGMWIIVVVGAFYAGGYNSPGLVWWAIPGISGVMLLGPRNGMVWMVAVILGAVAVLVAHKLGVEIRDDVSESIRVEAMFGSIVSSIVTYYLLARIYEDLKRTMLSEIDASKLAVERAHAAARTVLDNVSEGLVIAGRDGKMSGELSKALTDWFGEPARNGTVFDYLGRPEPRFGSWLAWEDVFADVLPREMALDLLPSRIERGARAAGKSENGVLTLSTRVEESMLAVRVADDGRGIDWSSVTAVARAKGLPAATRQDLEEAIFCDGISTKGGAGEVSGRGVGLAAVRAVVSEMGGSIRVESTAGRGTEFAFLLPLFKIRPSHGPHTAAS